MSDVQSIIFCGTPAFAIPSLASLAEEPSLRVDLVVTQPDRPVGPKRTITPPPIKEETKRLGIPVFQPERINEELPAFLTQQKIQRPDFLVVVAYGVILSEETLRLPTIAPINAHASLLPRWRGASPVEHAILAGDTETGVTIQVMVHELDAGPIVAQEAIAIAPDETAATLRQKLSDLGAKLLHHALLSPLHPRPQPTEGVTKCRTLTREDGQVDPQTMTAQEIERAVRAFTPWPGVTCTIDGHPLKIHQASPQSTAASFALSCAEGTTLHLITVQPPGKKPMSGVAWARGRR